MLEKKPLSLMEQASAKGKLLLIENFRVYINPANIKVVPKTEARIVESHGRKFKAYAVVEAVQVTKFTKNHNDRKYPKPLWERLIRMKAAEKTLCLANHPPDDEDGDVRDIVGVWHNFRLTETHGVADLHLVGPHGRHLHEILEAGGPCGMSSVGFGEMKEDDETVDPETYELVRLADWVLNPSQDVYATYENLSDSPKGMEESTSHKMDELKEDLTNKRGTELTERRKMEQAVLDQVRQMQELNQFNLTSQVKASMKEARTAVKESSPNKILAAKESISRLLAILPTNMQESRVKLEAQLDEVEEKLSVALAESRKKLKVTAEKAQVIESKYKTAISVLGSMKEKGKKAEAALASSQARIAKLEASVKQAIRNEVAMKENMEQMAKNQFLSEHDQAQFIKERRGFLEDMIQLMKDRKGMYEDNKVYEKRLRTFVARHRQYESVFGKMKKDIMALRTENAKLKAALGEGTMDFVGAPGVEDLQYPHTDEDRFAVQDDIFGDAPLGQGLQVDPALANMYTDENMGAPFSGEDFTVSNYAEKKKAKKMKESMQSRVHLAKKKAPKRKFGETKSKMNPDVKKFYLEKIRKNPGVVAIQSQILGSKSLFEAIRMVDFFLENRERAPLKLNESATGVANRKGGSDWLGRSR